MADDWDRFSASPYQQPVQAEASRPGMSPVALATYPFLLFDWPDSLEVVSAMLLGGKKGIWLDLLAAEEMGLSGQGVQEELARQGIEIYAKALYPLAGTIAAIIVVASEDEARTRKALASMGILL